jgi:hypothetical protein
VEINEKKKRSCLDKNKSPPAPLYCEGRFFVFLSERGYGVVEGFLSVSWVKILLLYELPHFSEGEQ